MTAAMSANDTTHEDTGCGMPHEVTEEAWACKPHLTAVVASQKGGVCAQLTGVDLVLNSRQLPPNGANQVVAQLAGQEVHAHILEVCISGVGLEELQLLAAR